MPDRDPIFFSLDLEPDPNQRGGINDNIKKQVGVTVMFWRRSILSRLLAPASQDAPAPYGIPVLPLKMFIEISLKCFGLLSSNFISDEN